MNSKINYSGYVEMFLDSTDDFEPYGYVSVPHGAGDTSGNSHSCHNQHQEYLMIEPVGD